jgi:hypothetical protein
MTCYACPFPIHVAARVLDVLLQVRLRCCADWQVLDASGCLF